MHRRLHLAERDQADKGQTFQTIANVGLMVGVAFAIVTTVIVIASRP